MKLTGPFDHAGQNIAASTDEAETTTIRGPNKDIGCETLRVSDDVKLRQESLSIVPFPGIEPFLADLDL